MGTLSITLKLSMNQISQVMRYKLPNMMMLVMVMWPLCQQDVFGLFHLVRRGLPFQSNANCLTTC